MHHRLGATLICRVFLFLVSLPLFAQSPTATINGQVRDTTGAVVPGADVQLINELTNMRYPATTNNDGIYSIVSVPPGSYRVQVSKAGFKTVIQSDITLNVLDARAINFELHVGAASEIVTVEAGTSLVNTESATVSTVVDRNFAENLPMNGRSFQSLIQLTPGVVLTANNGFDTGQFSVNGQRASSNYWTVDGVSANTGISAFATTGNGLGGALGSSSVFGGTNSLVSVDALQEFRIQTSTYAPEFGRTPGGQISIVTRSGTNQFHGTAFDYFRHDVLDASNWFNGYTNSPPLPKAQERQNDFGGTFSGPILKDRTFFFFSYEGLRLRLPNTSLTNVPDTTVRQNAVAAIRPYLDAFPLPNGSDNPATGIAQFNSTFSDPGTLDALSFRIDHKLTDKLNLFGRYNHSPSEVDQRGFSTTSLSTVSAANITTNTGTFGITWSVSPVTANDFRFNYSGADAASRFYLDDFGGAVPLTSLAFPTPFTVQNAKLSFIVLALGSTSGRSFDLGKGSHNQQRQFNIVDNLSTQKGAHSIKFGVDFRRLSPHFGISEYSQQPVFLSTSQAETGVPLSTSLYSNPNATFLFRNLGIFAQDTWRLSPRLTLTYGLRWDVDFAPSTLGGPSYPAVTGFDIHDLSQLTLAPAGTPPFHTPFANVAPRVGIAYQLSTSQTWQSVLRGGFGVFYDLATAEVGNNFSFFQYPFGASAPVSGSFPLDPAVAGPPQITIPGSGSGAVYAYDPNVQLPYALQWNVAVEQALGRQQQLTASYIGSAGKRLLQTVAVDSPNPNYPYAQIVTNGGTSNYNALQLQFQRQLSHGLQSVASYTWSHSIDTASASSIGNPSNGLTSLDPNVNRGPSDFDVRNAFSLGVTYVVPAPAGNAFTNAIVKGWSIESIVQARSAPPVDLFYSELGALSNGFITNPRPDVVAGQAFYLYGSSYPGGKAFNPAAFTSPPLDPVTGLPLRQGNLSRNTLRGFGATQWDFAVHRDFPIHESIKLQFRAEMFNVLNHPNFGQPVGDLGFPGALNPQFGQSIQMLGQSLSGAGSGGGVGTGGFNPLYQIGGPRSIQFALKLFF